jgi:hypothetical protein
MIEGLEASTECPIGNRKKQRVEKGSTKQSTKAKFDTIAAHRRSENSGWTSERLRGFHRYQKSGEHKE